MSAPGSPSSGHRDPVWNIARVPLTGSAVAEWFAARGMDVRGDIAPSHAFIDEAQVAEVSVRRIWHTALSLTRAATRTGSPRDTLLVQVAGEARLSLGDDAAVALGPNAVVFLPGGQAFSLVSDEPTARIEIDYRAHDRAAAWVHGAGELVSASMILSAVNALFHTPVSGGGGVISVATAVAASVEALIAAARAEAGALRASPRARPRDVVDYADLYHRASVVIASGAMHVDLTVDRVAQRTGVTRRQLERAFAAHGRSPGQMLREERLRLARMFLAADPDFSLASVAKLSGFPSERSLAHALAP
ncbi:helix-turn-helix domain-containing protein [Microbacterium testaceum]|uniref:helix-turn-helix domain-containing protein n=1 Tax=Microbacterium testaceum TaxID=2033 RepID=UPI000B339F0E|nr:helix-turn-helix domain-containing protein [Microbacterium testaceum]